jgi:hypothetical protein
MAEIISFSFVGWLLKRISESERQQVSKSFYAARKSATRCRKQQDRNQQRHKPSGEEC